MKGIAIVPLLLCLVGCGCFDSSCSSDYADIVAPSCCTAVRTVKQPCCNNAVIVKQAVVSRGCCNNNCYDTSCY